MTTTDNNKYKGTVPDKDNIREVIKRQNGFSQKEIETGVKIISDDVIIITDPTQVSKKQKNNRAYNMLLKHLLGRMVYKDAHSKNTEKHLGCVYHTNRKDYKIEELDAGNVAVSQIYDDNTMIDLVKEPKSVLSPDYPLFLDEDFEEINPEKDKKHYGYFDYEGMDRYNVKIKNDHTQLEHQAKCIHMFYVNRKDLKDVTDQQWENLKQNFIDKKSKLQKLQAKELVSKILLSASQETLQDKEKAFEKDNDRKLVSCIEPAKMKLNSTQEKTLRNLIANTSHETHTQQEITLLQIVKNNKDIKEKQQEIQKMLDEVPKVKQNERASGTKDDLIIRDKRNIDESIQNETNQRTAKCDIICFQINNPELIPTSMSTELMVRVSENKDYYRTLDQLKTDITHEVNKCKKNNESVETRTSVTQTVQYMKQVQEKTSNYHTNNVTNEHNRESVQYISSV